MSDERYSPQFVIDGAHAVMRAIDLDPASSVAANERVGAATFYTREQNGLVLPWFGRLFLNAPYSNYSEWIRKLADEKERVEQVFLLGPIPSLSLIADRCRFLLNGSILYPNERLKYLNAATGKMVGSPFGSFLAYYGPNQLRFARVFQKYGTIQRPVSEFYLRLARKEKINN